MAIYMTGEAQARCQPEQGFSWLHKLQLAAEEHRCRARRPQPSAQELRKLQSLGLETSALS